MSATNENTPATLQSSSTEIPNLAELLLPLKDEALKALKEGLESGNATFVKLWLDYLYGKAGQAVLTKDEEGIITRVILLPNGETIEI